MIGQHGQQEEGRVGLPDRRQRQSGRAVTRLPPDFARTLELYGRCQFDPTGSGINPSQIGGGNIECELFMLAQPHNDAVIRAVARVAIAAGGWALYGGERAVMSSVGYDPEVTNRD